MTAKVISSIVEKKLENESIALNARRSHSSINPAMPVRVNIATTDDCNLRCPTCIFPDHGMHHELSLQDFKEFAKELFPLAREYHTTLLGEPLLTSYFKEIPHILQQYQMQMSLVTNGMLLTKDVSNLIMPVLRDIKFSFDGATKQTFERIRPRSNFETILENIKQFLRLRNSSPYRPTITLLATVMYQNIRELPDIVELAHKLGVDRVKACFMVLRAPHMMSQSLWFHKELTNEYLSKAEVLARSYGIRTKFYKKFDLAGNYQTTENIREIDCRFLWEEAWIRINGDVVPCCNIDSPIVGNIHKEPFDAIWNNDIYQDMRKRTGSGEFYECCKYCILPNEDVRGDTFNYPYKSLVLI